MRLRLTLPALVIAAILPAMAAEWPEWREPGGLGHASAHRLPVEWSASENVAWKTPIPGRGWSSPVIDDDQIWMTTALETTAKLPGEILASPAVVDRSLFLRTDEALYRLERRVQ